MYRHKAFERFTQESLVRQKKLYPILLIDLSAFLNRFLRRGIIPPKMTICRGNTPLTPPLPACTHVKPLDTSFSTIHIFGW